MIFNESFQCKSNHKIATVMTVFVSSIYNMLCPLHYKAPWGWKAMEFYEAWQHAEDQDLRESLQRLVKRARMDEEEKPVEKSPTPERSPTSPADSPSESFRDAYTEGTTTSPSDDGLQEVKAEDDEVQAQQEKDAEVYEVLVQERKQQTVLPE